MTHLFRLERKCRTIAQKNLPRNKKEKKKPTQVTARQTSTHISSAFSLSGRSLETTASGRGHKRRWMLPAAAANSCLLCLLCFTHLAPARLPGARCNDIQNRRGYLSGALRLGFDSPGGAAHCVGRGHGKKKKKKSITRRLYLQSNFIPPAMRGGLSSEPCLAFKCGKSAQSPPLTRNAARLSSWCSLNKLNNEGISEMPKRHYTPTIRARSE